MQTKKIVMYSKKNLLFTICILVSFKFFAWKNDSLLKVTTSNLKDSLKIEAYYLLGVACNKDEQKKADDYFNAAEKLSKKNNNLLLSQIFYYKATYCREALNDFSKALTFSKIAIELGTKAKDYIIVYQTHRFIGRNIFSDLDLKEDAITEMKKAVECTKFYDNNHDKTFSVFELGWLEFNLGMTDSSLVHLKKAYNLCINNPKTNIADLIEYTSWLGNAYAGVKDYTTAIKYSKSAAHLADSANNMFQKYDAYRYIGISYANLKNYDSAIYYIKQCTDYLIKNKIYDRNIYVSHFLFRIAFLAKKYDLTEDIVKHILDTATFNYKKQYPIEFNTIWTLDLSNYYKYKQNFKLAFVYLNEYKIARDSSDSQKQRSSVNEQNLKYNFQAEQEALKLEQQRKDFEAIDKLKKQKIINYVIVAVLIIILVLLIMAYKIIKQKQEAFKIISQQKIEVENQKQLVDAKNKEISDSLNYAKRLQEAILPNLTTIKNSFSQSFVLYKPKDVVAGDFYFFEKLNNKLIIAAADCTGHGVPGAMVSVVCSNALNRSIKEFNITDAGKILDKTRELVIETFEKSNADVKDGMDISLLVIEKNGNTDFTIEWAGANNALWYFSENNYHELKPNKQPIGKVDNPANFTTHKINAIINDTFYLITDGYGDQFGGEKGKKFKLKHLSELIIKINKKDLNTQQQILNTSFENWRGNLEQLDDVCIIGIKL